MTPSYATGEGTLQPDGVTVQLDQKASLPPGRVTVMLQAVRTPSKETALEVLDRIHKERQQRGRRQMTEEEMNAEMAAMRAEDDDYEERWRLIWSQTQTPPHPVEKP